MIEQEPDTKEIYYKIQIVLFSLKSNPMYGDRSQNIGNMWVIRFLGAGNSLFPYLSSKNSTEL